VTTPRGTSPGPRPSRPAATSLVPVPRPGDKDLAETNEPYDLPFPDDRWPRRPEYVVVVDQLRGWQPDWPSSLAELLEPAVPEPANRSQT
jgi:hypothetical protein